MLSVTDDFTKKMSTESMIALCHIYKDFDDFKENVSKYIKKNNTTHDIFKIWEVSTHNGRIGRGKANKFYLDNKFVIDEINEHQDIYLFIEENFNLFGEYKEDSCIENFYEYIKRNASHLNSIISILEHISNLGIRCVYFDENYTFDNNYKMALNYYDNRYFHYLDNMQPLVNYDSKTIEYTSVNANFLLYVGSILGILSEYDRKIYLNNLLFGIDKLPNEISRETIFNRIASLKSTKERECNKVRNSVDLEISIDDLCKQYELSYNTINGLSDIHNKEEIIAHLKNMYLELEKLKKIGNDYKASILDDQNGITTLKLQEEKKRVLDKREMEKYDSF